MSLRDDANSSYVERPWNVLAELVEERLLAIEARLAALEPTP
jgi:hypothetical protein